MTDHIVGYLVVQTLVARSTYPVPNSIVRVYSSDSAGRHLVVQGVTDLNGSTKHFALPALPQNMYQNPSLISSFSTYDLEIEHAYFLPIYVKNVSLFENIVSIETVQMMPRSVAPDNTKQIQYSIPRDTIQ